MRPQRGAALGLVEKMEQRAEPQCVKAARQMLQADGFCPIPVREPPSQALVTRSVHQSRGGGPLPFWRAHGSFPTPLSSEKTFRSAS
jgi:hypothetical protein